MSKVFCLAALVVMLVLSTAQTQQDVDVPDCVHELDPCGPFVNSTTARPPTTCCQPLQNAIANDIGCLCSIFGSIEVIQTLNLNVTEALTLPQRCGIQVDLIARCQDLAPAEAPSVPTIAPTSGLSSGATAINTLWAGPTILGSFLVLATLMFY